MSTVKRRERFRIDFVFDVMEINDETRTLRAAFRPDPRRYDKVEGPEGDLYVDKFTNEAFRLEDIVDGMAGVPLFHNPPNIEDASLYADARSGALRTEVQTGEHIPPAEAPDAHRDLEEAASEVPLTFVSIDICGSTILRSLDPGKFDRAYEMMIREFGTALGQFHGTIFKATGDGIIAFFDGSSVNTQCDNCVDACLTLLRLLESAINPNLEVAGLPRLSVRIGAEHGDATIKRLVVPATGFNRLDIASDALNRAAKIQGTCKQGEFRVGQTLRRLLHVQWLLRASEAGDIGQKVGLPAYRVFSLA